MKKIAIIGAGISGLTCAWKLAPHHEVTLIEKNDYIGGHTHTVSVNVPSGNYQVDTGFIVCNDRTYPQFLQMLREWQVPLQETGMSFSVACQHSGLEYNGTLRDPLIYSSKNNFQPSTVMR